AAAAADGDDDDDDDAFDISIDEGFLGHSVLQGYTAPLPADGIKTRDKGRLPISSKNVFNPALLDSQRPVDEAIAIWRAASQQQTGSAGEDEDGDAAARATEAVDDQSVVLVRERDFAQLACFNGDWAIIELTTERIPRLVRLFAHPCPPKAHRSAGRKQLYMSPLLHQNLHRAHTFDPTRSASAAHLIPLDARRQRALVGQQLQQQQAKTRKGTAEADRARASPLPSCPLPIPFAESLTISRLASPLALDKAYQPLFLDALRTYFQPPANEAEDAYGGSVNLLPGMKTGVKRRLVKEGQLIAVGIQKGKVRFAREARANALVAGGGDEAAEDGRAAGEGGKEGGAGQAEGEGDDLLSDESFAGPPTGIVYFRVTALAPEATDPEPLPTSAPSSSRPSASSNSASASSSNGVGGPGTEGSAGGWDHDMQVLIRDRARRGEYGCVVDPEYTKMVQTGLENGRVADVAGWLGIASDRPTCPQQGVLSTSEAHSSQSENPPAFPATALTAPDTSPFDKLTNLVQATLLPRAQDFGLHLSVLIKGARGSGKKTICRWVAQRCGVHLLELNCYDLLSDTDARTEGVLRARFEKAASLGPAILLLQNIEALARKSQALESGQEPLMAGVLADCIRGLRKAGEARRRKRRRKDTLLQGSKEGADQEAHNKESKSGVDEDEDGEEEDDEQGPDEDSDLDLPLPIAVFATTSDPDKCPTSVLGCFKHEVAITAPNEAERLEILQTAVKGTALYPDVSLKSLATQTAALVAADLVDLVGRAKLAAMARLQKHFGDHAWSVSNAAAAGIALSGADFDVALNKARASYSESIGAPKIPNVTWDDVGGLASVKNDILDTIQLPLEHPELFSDGLKKRSGILLYGPPGTGKTLLAKAVATSCSLNFFSVKGPELLNMYIGESEANVRRVFQKARDAKPCVIFFDELDSVAPKRGNQGDSGGVMDRIVSQLLAELDGMAGGKEGTDVFVIGATNRPDLLDPALLRPGRFDRMLYLSVSETHEAQLNILQALTRKFKLDPDVGDLSVIAEQCPFNLTGADFYALCSDAMLKAMTRKAGEVDEKLVRINAEHPLNPAQLKNSSSSSSSSTTATAPYPHPYPITPQYYLAEMAQPAEIEVRVGRVDFEAALRELVPSVSEQEMEHYRAVQSKFSSPDDDKKKKKMVIDTGRSNGNDSSTTPTAAAAAAAAAERPQQGGSASGASALATASAAAAGKGKGKGKGKARAEADVDRPAVGDGMLMPAQLSYSNSKQ
ncbi:peroxisomal assembly protein, partial [Tilletia horrida]